MDLVKEESERSIKSIVEKIYTKESPLQFERVEPKSNQKDAVVTAKDNTQNVSKLHSSILDTSKVGHLLKNLPQEKKHKQLQTQIEKGLVISNRGFEAYMPNLINTIQDRKK